jgi:uncharacterized protein YggE
MAELSRKQGEVIAALVTMPTITEAATRAGVGERSLFRWLRADATFQAAYREARGQAVQQAITRIQQATSTAVKTLESVMKNTKAPSSSRVSAARAVLEMALKGVELEDLETRIAALKATVHLRSHGRNVYGA